MDDDFWGKLIVGVLVCFMVIYGAYHVGRWHQRKMDYAESCEPSMVCKAVKGGLDCRRVALW